jgi:hypothetical protein
VLLAVRAAGIVDQGLRRTDVDLAIKSAMAPRATAVAQSELSPTERSYLSRLPGQTLLLQRIAPEIEDRLQALNIVAQRDGLLVLTRKGRSLLRLVGSDGL